MDKSTDWNIWKDHPTLGVLNVGRHHCNSDLDPERVVELWRESMARGGYKIPESGEYARKYVYTALDNFGN